MIRQQIRAPNEGDRVGASGRNGTFEVVAVSTSPVNMVKLMLLGKPDFTIDVPWGALKFLDDFGHGAARIEKEAAKK